MVNWAKREDTFHLLLFAFMTDGGLEVCKVTRGIEPEDADMSQWADATECFLKTGIVIPDRLKDSFFEMRGRVDNYAHGIAFRVGNTLKYFSFFHLD